MRRLKHLLLPSLLGISALAAAETAIVSDHLPINVRGPGPEDRIIAAVRSGERLVVLERQPGYLRVRTPKGDEGWVLSRFTQTEPVARERLAAAEQARDAALARSRELSARLSELQAAHEGLQGTHGELQARSESLGAELARVRAAAASTLEIQQANEQLQRELLDMDEAMQALQLDAQTQDSRRASLILGAGILLAGLLLGLIIPFLRPRRSGWSDF